MRASFFAAAQQTSDPSFLVLVGTVFGLSKTPQRLRFLKKSRWRHIVVFVMS